MSQYDSWVRDVQNFSACCEDGQRNKDNECGAETENAHKPSGWGFTETERWSADAGGRLLSSFLHCRSLSSDAERDTSICPCQTGLKSSSSRTPARVPMPPVWLLPAPPRFHGDYVSPNTDFLFCYSRRACVETVPPVLLYRRIRGSLQQSFLSGTREKLWPPARHRRGGLSGQPVGCQQGQLHHGETTSSRDHTISATHNMLHVNTMGVCVQSLTGHKNPVECVQFNVSEDQIVTGSQSGSIRVWDMEAAKSKCGGEQSSEGGPWWTSNIMWYCC